MKAWVGLVGLAIGVGGTACATGEGPAGTSAESIVGHWTDGATGDVLDLRADGTFVYDSAPTPPSQPTEMTGTYTASDGMFFGDGHVNGASLRWSFSFYATDHELGVMAMRALGGHDDVVGSWSGQQLEEITDSTGQTNVFGGAVTLRLAAGGGATVTTGTSVATGVWVRVGIDEYAVTTTDAQGASTTNVRLIDGDVLAPTVLVR